MKRLTDFLWPAIAILAMGVSFWLLWHQLRGLSWGDVAVGLEAISAKHLFWACVSTLIAYAALAWYDQIALRHLGRKMSWVFISLVSFTTYALSHNVGATMFAGAMVRYRAYSTKGLSVAEVGVLVLFCSFTFALGTILLSGVVLVIEPDVIGRLTTIPPWTARVAGFVMLLCVGFYLVGSSLNLRPLTIGKFELVYPRLPVTLRQMAAGPIELLGAAGIIYFALPAASNPGFLVVLGVFLVSFSAALLSHAPGGLGVLETVFLAAMPDAPKAEVVAALIVFRLMYLLIPLAFAIVVVLLFERGRMLATIKAKALALKPGC